MGKGWDGAGKIMIQEMIELSEVGILPPHDSDTPDEMVAGYTTSQKVWYNI